VSETHWFLIRIFLPYDKSEEYFFQQIVSLTVPAVIHWFLQLSLGLRFDRRGTRREQKRIGSKRHSGENGGGLNAAAPSTGYINRFSMLNKKQRGRNGKLGAETNRVMACRDSDDAILAYIECARAALTRSLTHSARLIDKDDKRKGSARWEEEDSVNDSLVGIAGV